MRWKQGEWFETGRPVVVNSGGFSVNTGTVGSLSGDGPDPYLFLIYPNSAVGSKMYLDDDGAGFPDSKIVPPDGGSGTVILGSYARYTGGECRLAVVGQSYKAPWMSPGPWAFAAEPVSRTPSLAKYMEELHRQKRAFSKLSPGERDKRVLALQRELLSEEEVRLQLPRRRAVEPELVRRQETFEDGFKQMEEELTQLSYDERTARLAQLKRETMGKEYSEPETR